MGCFMTDCRRQENHAIFRAEKQAGKGQKQKAGKPKLDLAAAQTKKQSHRRWRLVSSQDCGLGEGAGAADGAGDGVGETAGSHGGS